MFNLLSYIPEHLLPTFISAIAIIIGAIVGGVCSWFVTKKAIFKNFEMKSKILEETRAYEEKEKQKRLCENASIIRLDICTALFQTIRTLKNLELKKDKEIYPIPVNCNYSLAVASLEGKFDLKEMSYIYQLYGIIEKLNNDIKNFHYKKEQYSLLETDYELFLKKLYGDRFKEILKIDIDKVSYKDLYDNENIKEGYKNVFNKLDSICFK